MVEPRIDQFQADHRHTGEVGYLAVRLRVGAKAGAGQDHRSDNKQIALALVDVAGADGGVSALIHPVGVGDGLAVTLGMPESRDDGGAVDDQTRVGGVDHVRQAGDRVDEIYRVPQPAVGVAQGFPLVDGAVDVDRVGGVHPGVDGVLDGEVRRPGHDVVAEALGARRHGGGGDIGGYRHESTIWALPDAINR